MDLLRVSVISDTAEAVTLSLCGHMTRQHLNQVDGILTDARAKTNRVFLDLQSLRLLDRDAACFLKRWQQRGVVIVNSPPFVARWVRLCPAE